MVFERDRLQVESVSRYSESCQLSRLSHKRVTLRAIESHQISSEILALKEAETIFALTSGNANSSRETSFVLRSFQFSLSEK